MPSRHSIFAATTALTGLLALVFRACPPGPSSELSAAQATRSAVGEAVHRLAVDSAEYPDHAFVYLLDEALVRFERDGRGTETYRQVVQVLTRDAVETWAEHTLTYVEGRQRLALNWVRVVGLDGTVVSDGPSHEQEGVKPADEENPVYSDEVTKRISLAGVAPGTIVDVSYTRETLDPVVAGDFRVYWPVDTWQPVRRSRLAVDLPADVEPRIREQHLDFERRTATSEGRRVYVWDGEVPAFVPEPFAPPIERVGKSVTVSAPIWWSDVTRWYDRLTSDRFEVTGEVDAALTAAVDGARSLDDSLRALHRWVAQDIRYVSLSLGLGGYRPRPPAEVVETGFGDCKDKAALFVAAARRFGVDAYLVLVRLEGEVDSLTPSVSQFDHVVAAYAAPEGYRFADLTAALMPWGRVPEELQGELGLLVGAHGTSELVRIPEEPADSNRYETTIAGELFSDGRFEGRFTLTMRGMPEYEYRDLLTESWRTTPEERRRLADAFAQDGWEGARGDSIELFEGRDLDADARLSVAIEVPRAAERSAGSWILALPLATLADPVGIEDLEAREARRLPIDLSEVHGPIVDRETFEVLLPAQWHADLPDDVTVEGVFGTYTARYEQEGRQLRIVRELVGQRGIEPPGSVDDLIEWLKGIERDGVKYLVLRVGSVT